MNLRRIIWNFLFLSLIGVWVNVSSANQTLAAIEVVSETEGDRPLEQAIAQTHRLSANSQAYYSYNRVDLNGDGLNDAVVYLTGSHFCGASPGCTIGIFQGVSDGYRQVATYLIAVPPLAILNTTTNGWQDLVINHYDPSQHESVETLYRFDGTDYQRIGRVNPDSISVDLLLFKARGGARHCLSGC